MAGTFGNIDNPLQSGYGNVNTGLPRFITNVVTVLFVAAGLFAFFNLIFAGYSYLSAAGDKAKLEKALSSINMSLVGLVIMVGAGIITAIISYLLFGDASYILHPKITGPGSI
jgi:TRAP-type C4-dicarboxylate transport system permease small subunit